MLIKGGEIRDTKNFYLLHNIVSFQVFIDVSRFLPCVINLSRIKNICCGLKKVVAQSRVRVYFEQQILPLLLVFHQTHNLSHNKFAHALANQPISTRISSTCNKCFVAGQVDHARWKTRNIDQNLQQNNVAWQVEGFCISYFAALRSDISKHCHELDEFLMSLRKSGVSITLVISGHWRCNRRLWPLKWLQCLHLWNPNRRR